MRRAPHPVIVAVVGLFAAVSISAAIINGQVLGGGAPIANSTVTLWAASAGAPKQLAQAKTGADGRFQVLKYLRANGYKTYIVTGGGQDFVRVYSEATYGIPRDLLRHGQAGAFAADRAGAPVLNGDGIPPGRRTHLSKKRMTFQMNTTWPTGAADM